MINKVISTNFGKLVFVLLFLKFMILVNIFLTCMLILELEYLLLILMC